LSGVPVVFANYRVPRKEDFFNQFFLRPFLDKTD